MEMGETEKTKERETNRGRVGAALCVSLCLVPYVAVGPMHVGVHICAAF